MAAAITASRIGPDDQQVLLVSAAGGNYQPGDWLEPKDGGNQRMMIVSAGPPTSVAASVLAPRSYSSNGMALAAAPPQFYARGGSVVADFKTQADLAPYMISGFNAAGTVQLDTVVSAAGDGGFVQLNVVCMQFEHDIPTRGARYFSVANAAEGPLKRARSNACWTRARTYRAVYGNADNNLGRNAEMKKLLSFWLCCNFGRRRLEPEEIMEKTIRPEIFKWRQIEPELILCAVR